MEKGFLNNSASKASKTDGNVVNKEGKSSNIGFVNQCGETADVQTNEQTYQQGNGDGNLNEQLDSPIIADWTEEDGDVNLSTRVDVNNTLMSPTVSESNSGLHMYVGDNVPKTTNICNKSNVVGSNTSVNEMGSTSFANVLSPERVTRKVNFRPLVNKNSIENHDTLLPKAAMESVLNRYDNTLIRPLVNKNSIENHDTLRTKC